MKIYTKGGDGGMTSLIGGKRVPKNHPRVEAYGNVDELSAHIGVVRSLTEHGAAGRVVAERVVAEKEVAEEKLAEREIAEREVAEKVVAEREVAEKVVAEKVVAFLIPAWLFEVQETLMTLSSHLANDNRLTNDNHLTNDNRLTNDNHLTNGNRLTNDNYLTNDNRLTNDNHLTNVNRLTNDNHLANRNLPPLPPILPEYITKLENAIDQIQNQLPPNKSFVVPGPPLAAAHCHVARTVCRRAERSVVALRGEVQPEIVTYLNRLSDFLFVLSRFFAKNF